MTTPTVVIGGYKVASFPEIGGHFWVYLQYALGLRQLGCDVYWLEAFRTKGHAEPDATALATFRARMQRYGLARKCIIYVTHSNRPSPKAPTEYLDINRDEAEAIFEKADLLLNFHYSLSPALLRRFRCTALVDIDPGLFQFWIRRGQLQVSPHDLYFTTGENVGRPGSKIPDCGLSWINIRPPVSLEHWPYRFDPSCEAFTTVSSWDSPDWIVDGEERYENTKRVAFLEFADLPRLTRQPLELALFMKNPRDMKEWKELEERGWRIRHSREVSATPEQYQAHIQHSRGEFSCAKPSCLQVPHSWVSDRTLCYLASGKPAIVQHTGPSRILPNAAGMFRFCDVKEAATAIEKVESDYENQCRLARALAEQHFDAKKVVAGVLEKALA